MLKFAGHPSVPDRYSVFSSLCNPDTGHHGQKFQFNAFQSLLLEANWRPLNAFQSRVRTLLLEATYRLTTYPTPEIKRDLADKLSRICNWFNYRRQRCSDAAV